jgi:biofilm protein TabA
MVVTDLDHVSEQVALTPTIKKALAFLGQMRYPGPKDGRIEIDGDKVYAIIQTYQTLTTGDLRVEAHRRYIDLHYIASGFECIACAPAKLVQSPTAYDESIDAWFGMAPLEVTTLVRLSAKQVAVFYPTDAHAPKLAVGQPARVTKVVVKAIIESGESRGQV